VSLTRDPLESREHTSRSCQIHSSLAQFAGNVKRHYRGAFRTLERAVDWWRSLRTPPAFIAQLGDLLDGVNVKSGNSVPALEAALEQLERAPCPSVNIVGNHELYNFDRAALSAASWLRHGDREYYSFAPAAGWRVVVLDPYQLALIGLAADDPRRLEAVELIARKNPGVHPSGSGGEWFAHVSGHGSHTVHCTLQCIVRTLLTVACALCVRCR
jgi:manganese-dependent ADP-ribose/CDP-alcohol diphosphatase